MSVRLVWDDLYGATITFTVNLPAKKALELWLRLAELVGRSGPMVVVEWLGENSVSEDEMAEKLAEIMLKLGRGPKALPGFDAVEAVREARED